MTDEKRKTDKQLWQGYWKTYKPNIVEQQNAFTKIFNAQPNGTGKTFLEIGGFPGIFSIWFSKHKNYNVSLLDFCISQNVTEKLLQTNNLPANTISIIETDFFNYTPTNKFDLVFSLGFIEHFENTNLVVKKHADCLSDGGKLLIIYPNLKGINGWVQRIFDKANYNIHVIACMELDVLQMAANEASLKDISVYYYGKPMVWLEPSASVSLTTRKLIRLLSMAIKLLPIKGKILSPYLVLEAKK